MLERKSAPTWLFSFVDLAFLLLIVFTQLAQVADPVSLLDFGELPLPQVSSQSTAEIDPTEPRWQVRVYPGSSATPFALISRATEEGELTRIDRDGLALALTGLLEESVSKPLLAPHEDARAADLLEAAGLIEDAWPGPRRATVAPVAAPVAAGPPAS